MCGIAGFNWRDKSLIEMMSEAIKHRGPDDKGTYVNGNVSLGHRRLSIIDISEKGHQPMRFENLVIVYNGEIYNFKEIRQQLKGYGYNFVSDSDTEVVLCGYHQWGPACVDRFNGMWAFCIYDSDENTLFLSRDRFGIKPLYYYFDSDRFIFASSLNAIRKYHLNLNISNLGLNHFFYQKYIGGNRTIFENCWKLKSSENLTFDLSARTLIRTKYYYLEDDIAKCQNIPLKERLDLVKSTLAGAVDRRLIADVPVGSFLSGGVDSSLICAIVTRNERKLDTFSIGFKDRSYNELKYSQLVSQHIQTEHHYDYMEADEDTLKFVIGSMDEPFGDASVFPTYLLSKLTSRKSSVVLSGDAGDEVFGGYDTYKAYKIARYIPKISARLLKYLVALLPPSDRKLTLAFKIARFARNLETDMNRRHLDWMATFDDCQRERLLTANFVPTASIVNCNCKDSLVSIQVNDVRNYLAEDILKKVDFASMLNSLEVRVPFLDRNLVPLVLSLPEKYKIRRFKTKWLLKKIASSYLPNKIVNRRKRGFTVPVSEWIRKSDLIREFLTSRWHYEHALLNYAYVQGLYNAHIKRRQDNARQLWLVFVFNYWWNKNGR